jgi:hypothetical protein
MIRRALRQFRRWLLGTRFTHSVERFERAARDLDKAVREVMQA